MIYNDGYAAFAGSRHPELLGMPVLEGWPEAAEFNRRVMRYGARRRVDVVSRQALQPEAARRTGGRVDQSRLQPGTWRGRQTSRRARDRRRHDAVGACRARPARERVRASAHSPTTSPPSPGWPTRPATSTGTTSAGSTTRACRSTSPSSGAGRCCSIPTMSSASWRRSTAACRPARFGKTPFR